MGISVCVGVVKALLREVSMLMWYINVWVVKGLWRDRYRLVQRQIAQCLMFN